MQHFSISSFHLTAGLRGHLNPELNIPPEGRRRGGQGGCGVVKIYVQPAEGADKRTKQETEEEEDVLSARPPVRPSVRPPPPCCLLLGLLYAAKELQTLNVSHGGPGRLPMNRVPRRRRR